MRGPAARPALGRLCNGGNGREDPVRCIPARQKIESLFFLNVPQKVSSILCALPFCT